MTRLLTPSEVGLLGRLGDGGSQRVYALLPDGRYVAVLGGHMSAVIKPDLGRAMADFLAR